MAYKNNGLVYTKDFFFEWLAYTKDKNQKVRPKMFNS